MSHDICLVASCFIHRHRPFGLSPPISTARYFRRTSGRTVSTNGQSEITDSFSFVNVG